MEVYLHIQNALCTIVKLNAKIPELKTMIPITQPTYGIETLIAQAKRKFLKRILLSINIPHQQHWHQNIDVWTYAIFLPDFIFIGR